MESATAQEVTHSEELTIEQITQWLQHHKYGIAALELHEEMKRRDGCGYAPLIAVAETVLQSNSSCSRNGSEGSCVEAHKKEYRSEAQSASVGCGEGENRGDARGVLLEALRAYSDAEGIEAARTLVEGAGIVSGDKPDLSPSPPLHDEQGALDAAALRTVTERLQNSERQLKQVVAQLAESLPTLVSTIDPMRKEVLLPLLCTVAVLGPSGTGRAAARQGLLTLFSRPTAEHRAAIVGEWVRVAQAAAAGGGSSGGGRVNTVPACIESSDASAFSFSSSYTAAGLRVLEQEVAPELYSLVNSRAVERRLLALDCVTALAPLLLSSHKLCHALCQGLLRPLSEDESAVVRREVPRCLAALWPGIREDDVIATGQKGGSSGGHDDDPLTHRSTIHLELVIRLALDPFSNSVRHAAQTQLKEVIYPLCLEEGILLEEFVPLLMGFLAMEGSAVKGAEAVSGAGGGPGISNGAPPLGSSSSSSKGKNIIATGAARDEQMSRVHHSVSAPANAAAAATNSGGTADSLTQNTLALGNTAMLVRLIYGAVRCVRTHIVSMYDSSPPEAVAARLEYVCHIYTSVVLPTAFGVVAPLLAAAPHWQLTGCLCGLAASLAAPVSLFDAESWELVRTYLASSVQVHQQQQGKRGAAGVDMIRREESASAAGWLYFFNSFLIRLCGEQAAFEGDHVRDSHTQQPGSVERAVKRNECSDASAEMSSQADEEGHDSLAVVVVPAESIANDSVMLLMRVLVASGTLVTTDARVEICARCVASLSPLATESVRLADGITALLWACVGSSSPSVRLRVVTLASRACALIMDDAIKTSLICPALSALMNDTECAVQEMAVRSTISVAVALTSVEAQASVLGPAFEVVEASGCTSDLTVAVLRQWESLLVSTPAEPRENFLYPQLASLMNQLAHQQVHERAASASAAQRNVPVENELAQWEKTMLALDSLLQAVLRCAVVTPPLVERYLLPGLRHFVSANSVLAASSSSATLRSRWLRTEKLYTQFVENSRAGASGVATQNAANLLLSRVREEFKRRF